MSRFSFINLLNEGETPRESHEHVSKRVPFRHRVIESEIVKPKSRFTFADFLKSQNEPEESNSDYVEDELDNPNYNEVELDNSNELDNPNYNEVEEPTFDSEETDVEVLKPVEVGQEQSIQNDLLNDYAKIDDLDKVELNIKIVDPKTNAEAELKTTDVFDKLDTPLNVNVVEPEEKPQVNIEIAKPEETNVEVKSSDDVTLESNKSNESNTVETEETPVEETKEQTNSEETK